MPLKEIVYYLMFLLLLNSFMLVNAQPEQLKALVNDEEIKKVLEDAKIDSKFLSDTYSIYYDESSDKYHHYYASVCHGGSKAIGCKRRKVEPREHYYFIANPVGIPPLGGAHYLYTATEDYLVVKVLGELWFIKPLWNDKEECYFELWKWTPSENFFEDGSYTLAACDASGTTVFPKSGDTKTVKAFEESCGIVFDAVCRGSTITHINDIVIKDLRINPSYFAEMIKRRNAREKKSKIELWHPSQNECGFKIKYVRYRGKLYEEPTYLEYDAEAEDVVSVTFTIDTSCKLSSVVFGLWDKQSLLGSPAIPIKVENLAETLSEKGSATIDIKFEDASAWGTKYLGAKANVEYTNEEGKKESTWVLTQSVEIKFSEGGAAREEEEREESKQTPSDCLACYNLVQCLACIAMLLLQAI